MLCQLDVVSFLSAQNDSIIKSEIDKIIKYDTDISLEDVPGFTIGIIDHDSSYIFTYQNNILLSINDSSIYEIGGLTKVFTAHLCQILANENIINLHHSINEYLPASFQSQALNEITLYHLVTHTSGLPSRPDNFGVKNEEANDPYLHYTKKDLGEYLSKIRTPTDTGHYIYSHLNYAILEIILEHVTQQSFAQIIHNYIFLPRHMNQSFVSDTNRIISPGFDRSLRKCSPWTFSSFAASEGIKSSCPDLIAYVKYLMNSDDGQTILKSLLPAQIKIPRSKKAYAALGWHLYQNRKNKNLYLHSGKTSGHAASIHFMPSTKTAVILLTNSPVKMDGIATLVLRMLNDNWKRKI
ncbi:MAG: serine hydrolase [Saprospiraceae bacterium]|nr:serine hydrolase [Saprospiraceae bacterium]